MVETGLQLRLTQKLALAPQLQQAIRLLQLTRIELRQHIQQTVEANPLLEYEDLHSDSAPEEFADTADDPSAEDARESGEDFEAGYENNEDWGQETLPGENWSEPSGWEGERQIADRSEDSLREHLLFQVSLGQFNPVDSAIATAIVFALDDDGYLPDSLEEIRASLAPDLVVELDEVRAVLRRIQRMEPVGVASRDPAECIRVQLSVVPAKKPGLELARRVAREFIDLVAERDLEALRRETGASESALDTALELIRGLEPRPGARYDNRLDEYLVPDVYVRRVDERWTAYLSPDNDPRLKLNKYYIQLLRQSGGENRDYLQGRLQEARWLLSSLELRNQTLLKVAQCIADQQEGFLERGELAMRPLILKEVSELIGVHESTVSRATTRKYMLTPRGLFELKYFFSSHVATVDGGVISATAVKARLQMLIENEPQGQPLSDQELSRLLRSAGIRVARRTVAKYRESLGIGSSSERRKAYRRMTRKGKT
jgi:RNA polymerase sigma-54 factor